MHFLLKSLWKKRKTKRKFRVTSYGTQTYFISRVPLLPLLQKYLVLRTELQGFLEIRCTWLKWEVSSNVCPLTLAHREHCRGRYLLKPTSRSHRHEPSSPLALPQFPITSYESFRDTGDAATRLHTPASREQQGTVVGLPKGSAFCPSAPQGRGNNQQMLSL